MFGYLTELDDVVGDVVAAMKAAGRYDHSLIIFSSDNGAPPAHDVRGRNWPFRTRTRRRSGRVARASPASSTRRHS